jgi:dihydrofolate reductase
MSRTVYYAAISLDGFIATLDGGVAWLDPFNSPDLGYEPFLAKVGAVVLGRATYEQALTFGPWPYPGRRGLVVTSRPVSALPPDVRAVTLAELPAALRALRASVAGDTWIVGGGQTASACLDAGLIDELELYLVPRLLGDGIPLLARQPAALTLRVARAFPSGVVMLRYAVART